MEPIGGNEVRSISYGVDCMEIGDQGYQFNEEFQRLMADAAPVSGNSFTALLELPANQAMELLHSSGVGNSAANLHDIDTVKCHRGHGHEIPYIRQLNFSPTFPSDAGLIERAAKYSFFATAAAAAGGVVAGGQDSPESSSTPSDSELNAPKKVKNEPADSGANPNSVPQTPDPAPACQNEKQIKRKDRKSKGKGSSKKSRIENSDNGEKLPYVHVRARRGQATDSHSLAERARREKINARMKLLQELVPGCNKRKELLLRQGKGESVLGGCLISGTALVLDEIINHVQSLQRQVEVLSMRIAAVNPRIDFNLDSLFASGNGSAMDSNFLSMADMPLMWPEIQFNGQRQQCQQQWHFESLNQLPLWAREEDHQNHITPENSLLSYDSSANSASFHSSQLKKL